MPVRRGVNGVHFSLTGGGVEDRERLLPSIGADLRAAISAPEGVGACFTDEMG